MKNHNNSFTVFRYFLISSFLVRLIIIISYFLICVIFLFLYELTILPELSLNSTGSPHSYLGEYALPHNGSNTMRLICSVAEETTKNSKNADENSNVDANDADDFDPDKGFKKEWVLMEDTNEDLNDFYLWSWNLPTHAQYLILQDNRFFFDALCFYVENTGSFIPNRIVYGDLQVPITDIEWYIKYLEYLDRPPTADESGAFLGPDSVTAGVNLGLFILAISAIVMGYIDATKD